MKKWILLASVFIFASFNVDAQLSGQARIDSLLKELPKAKQDTNHVNLLAQLSFSLYSLDPDQGIEYAEQGLKLAKELNWKKGGANCYSCLGTNYSGGKSDYPKALEYYQKALIIYKEIGNKRGIAQILGNIGIIHAIQSDYSNALEYFHKALKFNEKIGNKKGIAQNLGNIGNIYRYQSNYPKALEYYQKSLKINEELDRKSGLAVTLGNIGSIYRRQSDDPKALEYYQKSLKIKKEIGNKKGIAGTLHNLGNIFTAQSNYPKALEYYHKALKINTEIGNKSWKAKNLVSIGIIYHYQSDYPKTLEYFQKALKINEEIGNENGVAHNLGAIGVLYLKQAADSVINNSENRVELALNKEINLNKAIEYILEAIKIYEEIGDLDVRSSFLKNLADAYKQKGDYKKAYEAHVEFKNLQDSVFNMDKSKKIATLTATREKEVAEKELKIQKLENIRRRNESYALYGGLALFAVVLFVIYRQRKRSEKLLLNILPAAIAKRLKAKEHPIADHFENTSVVFIDIVSFTELASDATANHVVEVLNIIFTKFDEIAAKYKLEKIKTIGDSYMAVTGVPIPDQDHAKNMAKFALEVKAEMHNYRTEDDTLIQFRIGIDCGDVVAGVIGSNKFIYDLWGDTVNTASRMESNGTPDEIHVTELFRDTLSDSFQFVERGEMDIKGKGMMKTYYLKGEE